MDQAAITDCLKAWRAGDDAAFDVLIALVYDEMRAISRRHLEREYQQDPAHLLHSAELTHEALLSLAGKAEISWQDRAHFFAMVSRSVRRALIVMSRKRDALKRGPDVVRTSLEEELTPGSLRDPANLLLLDQLLDQLEQRDPTAVRIIELRVFSGFSVVETAEILGISTPTVKRKFSFTRTWLYKKMTE